MENEIEYLKELKTLLFKKIDSKCPVYEVNAVIDEIRIYQAIIEKDFKKQKQQIKETENSFQAVLSSIEQVIKKSS